MSRVKRGVNARKRRKEVIKQAKGFYGRSKNCYTIAFRRVEKAKQYSYRDRKNKKRWFRALWIQRINAAARACGMTYSVFMRGLFLANIQMDRKILANFAYDDMESFEKLTQKSSEALASHSS